jgi:hypothetical protein
MDQVDIISHYSSSSGFYRRGTNYKWKCPKCKRVNEFSTALCWNFRAETCQKCSEETMVKNTDENSTILPKP